MQLLFLTQRLYDHFYRDLSQFRQTLELPCKAPGSLKKLIFYIHFKFEELTELATVDCKVGQGIELTDSVKGDFKCAKAM